MSAMTYLFALHRASVITPHIYILIFRANGHKAGDEISRLLNASPLICSCIIASFQFVKSCCHISATKEVLYTLRIYGFFSSQRVEPKMPILLPHWLNVLNIGIYGMRLSLMNGVLFCGYSRPEPNRNYAL